MNKKQGKRYYKTLFKKIFEENIDIFTWYEYMYTGSLVLYRWLAKRKKIPDDIDAAINWDNKGIKDLENFCQKIIHTPGTSELKVKTVFAKTYTIHNKIYTIEKQDNIDTRTIDHDLLQILLDSGNIRISYKIHGIIMEIFPEKNGAGLRNLWNMKETIQRESIKTSKKTKIMIPFQNHLTTAEGYAMNFLKEIVRNNIYRFTDQWSKPKDGIRLFTIISLLEKEGEDASPEGIIAFIKHTVKKYNKIPEKKRSLYIDGAIKAFPWIENMMKEIIKEYHKLIKRKDSKKYRFTSFYKKLWTYKKELNTYVNYLEHDMLSMLKKDVLWEKYTIIDAVKSFSKTEKIYDSKELKNISKNLKKIIQSIENIWIRNKNESFAYFYEMYMLKNLFIKPIKKIL